MNDLNNLSHQKTPIQEVVNSFLNSIPPGSNLFVGFSGGLDSTVLLHALARQLNAIKSTTSLNAIYINHGIQKESKLWAEHCRSVCESLNVNFITLSIDLGRCNRQGLESKARQLRYQAFEKVIDESGVLDAYLITGHHQRDQAETLLLNLFRGSGVGGLSAMPIDKIKKFTKPDGQAFNYTHYRPLLNIPYMAFQNYANQHSLSFVEDESNQDTHFRRNYIRLNVLPELESVWPKVQANIANTASNVQEASILLDRLAQDALKKMNFAQIFIELVDFEMLDWIEQKNIIRYWFKAYWPSIVLTKVHYAWILDAFENYVTSKNSDYRYKLRLGELRFYKSRLYYLPKQPEPYEIELTLGSNKVTTGDCELNKCFDKNKSFYFINNKIKPGVKVTLRSIKASDLIDRKKLKAFFQQNKIPSWERPVWPVMQFSDQSIAVLGCDRCQANLVLKDDSQEVNNKFDLSYCHRLKLMKIL